MQKFIKWLNEERGRRSRLARFLGITPGAISLWPQVPAERVGKVSEFTGIALHELRPDLFAKPKKEAVA